jgi:hypothetical protein
VFVMLKVRQVAVAVAHGVTGYDQARPAGTSRLRPTDSKDR